MVFKIMFENLNMNFLFFVGHILREHICNAKF